MSDQPATPAPGPTPGEPGSADGPPAPPRAVTAIIAAIDVLRRNAVSVEALGLADPSLHADAQGQRQFLNLTASLLEAVIPWASTPSMRYSPLVIHALALAEGVLQAEPGDPTDRVTTT